MRKPNPATAPRRAGRTLAVAAALATAALVLGGCMGETFTRGQKITAQQLEPVPVGSSREQVSLALGAPSPTGVACGVVFC
jgi:outer membrane protein assembly factor BamE (lipoprotein component of BamABCDE complex)